MTNINVLDLAVTDQLNTLQKRFNWYLNETDDFVATY